jgi:putative transposase
VAGLPAASGSGGHAVIGGDHHDVALAPHLGVERRDHGGPVNHKRLLRVYREEGLTVRRRLRRRLTSMARRPLAIAIEANERWSMDFVADTLVDGRSFRTLTIVDDFTRECPAIEVDTSLPGLRVTRVLERLAQERGLPRKIVVDNGTEFTSRIFDAWAHQHGIEIHFIRPGRPI